MLLSSSYTRVGSVTTVMYHGTDRKNLPIILSQGLIPNPKKRAWEDDPGMSFYTPSRASLPGIYLTTNLMTATSAGRRQGNYGKCLVVVQVQSGSLLADEDDIKFRLNESIPNHEYTVAQLYQSWKALNTGAVPDARDIERMAGFVTEFRDNFVKSVLSGVEYRLKGGLKDQEKEQLIPLLTRGFYVALTRRASHLSSYVWGHPDDHYGVDIPDKSQAEQDFKNLEDKLTRTLKRLGRPEHLESKLSPTARIETPITYSGKNRIIAVVEIFPYIPGDGTPVIVRYPRSGEVPSKLIEDYTQSQGDWDEAVARGQRMMEGVPA